MYRNGFLSSDRIFECTCSIFSYFILIFVPFALKLGKGGKKMKKYEKSVEMKKANTLLAIAVQSICFLVEIYNR